MGSQSVVLLRWRGILKGAQQIGDEVIKRNLPISVIDIPKTINNDLLFDEKTFGDETSAQTASAIISSAHHEAEGAENGVGIGKLLNNEGALTLQQGSKHDLVHHPYPGGDVPLMDRRSHHQNFL